MVKKTIVGLIFLASTIALFGAVVAHNGTSKSPKAVVKTLNPKPAICKELRVQTLKKAASDTSDPKVLIKAGFQLATQQYQDALRSSTAMGDVEKDSLTSGSLKGCAQFLELGIDRIKNSSDKFDQSHSDQDLITWISAAISYKSMCMDSMEMTSGQALETLEKMLPPAAEALGNIISCIDEISKSP